MPAPERLRHLTRQERDRLGRHLLQHGSILGFAQPQQDTEGRIANPVFRLSQLERWERQGMINTDMRQAGERFHALFRRACLDSLKAADVSREVVSGGGRALDLPHGAEAARRRVAEALRPMGGHQALVGSCVWHILGLEWSVAAWARRVQRSPQVAVGVLIAALGALAGYFNGPRRA
jgi:hypothetical protein